MTTMVTTLIAMALLSTGKAIGANQSANDSANRFANDQTTSTRTYAISVPQTTWTISNNRSETDNPLQSNVTDYRLTSGGSTYIVGSINAGNTATRTVGGTSLTATYIWFS